ncbi:hypothetical protein ANN_09271 [Periplaneta americana]|uniref:Uncharacterized protein n=1 Tax=Periplaneta americana TaxID=6978 RepID=A0ABQ8TL77_PERAM|nr:hypothetical protein ANN_09271 [Periplaneta americana]
MNRWQAYVKMTMNLRIFASAEEVKIHVTSALRDVTKDGLQECFEKWYGRWQKCVTTQWAYFEGGVMSLVLLNFGKITRESLVKPEANELFLEYRQKGVCRTEFKLVETGVKLVQLPRFLHESLSSVRPVYVIDVYKLTPSNGPKERSRRARDLTVASDNLSAIEFRPVCRIGTSRRKYLPPSMLSQNRSSLAYLDLMGNREYEQKIGLSLFKARQIRTSAIEVCDIN